MSTKTVFFSDLDDTLVQSTHKIQNAVEYKKISTNRSGEYIGSSTSYQLKMMERMSRDAITIPVTGRNKAALDRFEKEWSSYQIVSHGAVVLNQEGQLDKEWEASIQDEVLESNWLLANVSEKLHELKETNHSDAEIRIIQDMGITCYLCVKGKKADSDIEPFIEALKEHMSNTKEVSQWRIHANGRNLAFLPPYANKARAVRFVKEKLNLTINDLTIGLGDSMSDLQFMNECHLWITPTQGQINEFLNKQDQSGAIK